MTAQSRAATFRRLIEHAREVLGLPVGFRLWDGSLIPAQPNNAGITIHIADEGAVAGLLRKPSAETLANLYVAKRIDFTGGTIFDLAATRTTVRTRHFRKHLDKGLMLRTLLPFLFVSRGGPWPLEHVKASTTSSGDPVENQRNISFHYDVSNDFYRLFLDPDMVYSCGYAHDWSDDIGPMQQNKFEMICRKLRLKSGETMLDVGCGWGGLLIYAAQHYGIIGTGVTLSQQQFDHATARIKALGLQGRLTIRLGDYTSVVGTYDKIASVGMHEHVGIRNYPTYYRAIHKLLAPDGIYLHHAITYPGKHNRKKRRNRDFELLTRYIFPGGELDTIGNTVVALERYGFEVHDVEDWREHYARTCRLWHDRLLNNYDAACAEVGEAKTRLYLAYLGGCAIAFERGTALIYQTVATKRRRGASPLPPTRADLYR